MHASGCYLKLMYVFRMYHIVVQFWKYWQIYKLTATHNILPTYQHFFNNLVSLLLGDKPICQYFPSPHNHNMYGTISKSVNKVITLYYYLLNHLQWAAI